MATQKYDSLPFKFEPDEDLLNEEWCAKVAEAAEGEDVKTRDVAEQFDIQPPKVLKAIGVAEDGLISFRSPNELAKRIVSERHKKKSWGNICGRLGDMSGTRVRNFYEQEAEQAAHEFDAGLGGRPKGVADGEGKTESKSAKAKTKKSSKKAAKKDDSTEKSEEGSSESVTFEFADDADPADVVAAVAEMVEGKTLTVARPGGKTAEITVVSVDAAKQNKSGAWGVKVTSDDDKTPAFGLSKIQAIA